MSAVRDARLLLANRARRKVAIKNLEQVIEEAGQTIRVTARNDTSEKVFGMVLDPEVVAALDAAWERFEAHLRWCVDRLTALNEEEES